MDYSNLPIGTRKKLSCPECFREKSMSVLRDTDHALYKCHACGYGGRAQLEATLKDYFVEPPQPVSIKHIQTAPIESSLDMVMWLSAAGISPETATRHGLRYLPYNRRAGIISDTKTAWQMRLLTGTGAKYITIGDKMQFRRLTTDYSTVVVEDALSCIKLSVSGFSSLAMLGTNGSPRKLLGLNHAVIWMDNDRGGELGVKNTIEGCRSLGIPYTIVRSDKDPKKYDYIQLKEILHEKYRA